MASTGSPNDRSSGPGGWEDSGSVPSLHHSGLSLGHNGEGSRPLGGNLSSPSLGVAPPGFNADGGDSRSNFSSSGNQIWSSKDLPSKPSDNGWT